MRKDYIVPTGVPPATTYSHAVKVSNTIYIAGQVGRDASGNVVPGGIAEQARQTFENLRLTLLACGATLQDIVKLTLYLTNLQDMPVVASVRSQYLCPPMPASAAVEVANLAPGILLEIEGIAVIG